MITNKPKNVFTSINSLVLLSVVITFLNLISTQALANDANNSNVDNPELKLHSELVHTALQLDFYNNRCRGTSVAKNFNEVNRLYITKYSITANNFIKEFINQDVRAEKEAQEIEFRKNLNRLGGCAKAKDQDWIKEIHDTFRELYQEAEKSAWFPEKIE